MGKIEEYKMLALFRAARDQELRKFLAKPALREILTRFVSFLTDDSATKIRLNLTAGSESFTDGTTITIGMPDEMFAPDYIEADWVTIFKALLAHEVQHINSSNFNDMRIIGADYADLMAPKGIPKESAINIGKEFLNIMEDSRIDNIIIRKYPGFRLAFLLLINSLLQYAGPDERADSPYNEYLDFRNNALCYALTGRLAPNMKVYAGTRLEREFKAVQPLFDAAVDARTSEDCRKICMEMLTKTADYFADLLKTEQAQMQVSKMQRETDEYTSNEEREYNDPAPSHSTGATTGESAGGTTKVESSPSQESTDSAKGEENGEEGSPQKKKAGQNALRSPQDPIDPYASWTDDFSEIGPEDYLAQAITIEELAAMRRGVQDEFEAEEKPAPKPTSDPLDDKIEQIYSAESTRTFKETFPSINNAELPTELAQTAARLSRAFERILRQKRSEQRHLRSGILDMRSLYRHGFRDPHLFMRKGQPLKADMAVFLLMDNSGSMGGLGAKNTSQGTQLSYSKSALSRVAAAIVEASLSKFATIKISLFDVSCGEIRHATLRRFDDQFRGSRAYNSIESVGIGGGNKDGYSIRVATKELLARREQKKVLVVLSDGLPSDYNGGERAGMLDVQSAVKEARRRGIIVIPIMFGDRLFRNAKAKEFTFMYNKYISCDPISIADEFQKIFSDLIQRA